MKINYEFTLEDCILYVKETFFIKRLFCYFIKDNIRKALFCAFLLSFLFAWLFFDFNIKYILILFILAFLFAYITWGFMGYYSGGKYVYRLLDGFDKNYELTIERDIIKRTSGSGESSHNWGNVKDIYNTKRNIIIFVSNRQAIVVPKRVFNSEQEADDFWFFISECYNNVQNNNC